MRAQWDKREVYVPTRPDEAERRELKRNEKLRGLKYKQRMTT